MRAQESTEHREHAPAVRRGEGRRAPEAPGRQRPSAEERLEMLTRRYSLTTEQQAQVETLLAAEEEKLEAIRNKSLTQEERQTAFRETVRETREAIDAILTSEQKESAPGRIRERRGPAEPQRARAEEKKPHKHTK